MYISEKTAKTKWCPFARTGAFTDRGAISAVTVNRDPRPEVMKGTMCIGSKCMAWLWMREAVSMGRCGLVGE